MAGRPNSENHPWKRAFSPKAVSSNKALKKDQSKIDNKILDKGKNIVKTK